MHHFTAKEERLTIIVFFSLTARGKKVKSQKVRKRDSFKTIPQIPVMNRNVKIQKKLIRHDAFAAAFIDVGTDNLYRTVNAGLAGID